MVNGGAAASGVPGCAANTTFPIVQDATDDPLLKAVGTANNATAVIDRNGVLVARILGKDVVTATPDIEAAVAGAM